MTLAGKISSYFSTILPARVSKGPVDDHVPDPDVRRRDRDLPKTMFRFDMHGVDDDVPSVFQDLRTGGPDPLEDARLATWGLAVGVVSFLISSEETISTPCPADHLDFPLPDGPTVSIMDWPHRGQFQPGTSPSIRSRWAS
jgi:hypothetical protein